MKYEPGRRGVLRQCGVWSKPPNSYLDGSEDEFVAGMLLPNKPPPDPESGSIADQVATWHSKNAQLIKRVERAHGPSALAADIVSLLIRITHGQRPPHEVRELEASMVNFCRHEYGLAWGVMNAVGHRPLTLVRRCKGALEQFYYNCGRSQTDGFHAPERIC